jgi:hypothetical protein
MTSLSDTPTVETPAAQPTTVTPFKRRGRPVGVKNGDGVVNKKKPAKRTVKNPRLKINVDAIVANGEIKNLKAEVERLMAEVKRWTEAHNGARLHIEKLEKHHKAALAVIGYLEGKVFNE